MSSCFACGVCMTHASSSLVIGWSSGVFCQNFKLVILSLSEAASAIRHASSAPSCHHHTELAMLVSHSFSKKSKSIHSLYNEPRNQAWVRVSRRQELSNVSKGGDLPRHVVSFDEHDSKCNNDTNTVQQKIRRRIPLDYSKPCGASLTRRRNDPACMRLSTMTCSIMHVMMMTTSSHYFKTHFVVLPL
jgi:hypothetical protein